MRGAKLERANLSDADLREVRELHVDSCSILHARFSPRATDKWSVLRRTYTGPNLVINLIFLILFFTPLILKGASLSAFGDAQQRMIEAASHVDGIHLKVACDQQERAISGEFRGVEVNVPCRSQPMWKLLLGSGGPYGMLMPILTGILIAYQVARALLTRQISLMRDAEERSGITPPLNGVFAYPHLYCVHRVLSFIAAITLVAFMLRAVEFLFFSDVILMGNAR